MITISYTLLSGKDAAYDANRKLAIFIKNSGIQPVLAVIVVGDNSASAAYVRGKQKDCEECNIECRLFKFDETVTESELIKVINDLNNDDSVDGIIVQLPLPRHIPISVVQHISAVKDVDCFRIDNVGRLATGDISAPLPCTPLGVIKLLSYYNIDVTGKDCVVIGRSNIVGKPMAMLLTHFGATVTLCHSKTKDLAKHTRSADIIICAVGKPKFLTSDMVSSKSIVIDVGINRDEHGKLCGDVDFENVSKVVSAITPVPGGVGLMTRATLLFNVVTAYYIRRG